MNLVLSWLKKNWLPTLIVALMALAIVGLALKAQANASLYEKLFKTYNQQAASHDLEVQKLNGLHEKQMEKLKELEEKYDDRIILIEEAFSEELQKLKRQTKLKRNVLLEQSKDNPEILTNAVKKTFGIPIYGGSQ